MWQVSTRGFCHFGFIELTPELVKMSPNRDAALVANAIKRAILSSLSLGISSYSPLAIPIRNSLSPYAPGSGTSS